MGVRACGGARECACVCVGNSKQMYALMSSKKRWCQFKYLDCACGRVFQECTYADSFILLMLDAATLQQAYESYMYFF